MQDVQERNAEGGMLNKQDNAPVSVKERVISMPTQKERILQAVAGKAIEKLITAVRLPGGAIELAINTANLDAKIEYIKGAYDDDLRLRTNPEIKLSAMLFITKDEKTYLPRAAVYDIFTKSGRAANATYLVTVIKDHRDGSKNISIETDNLTQRCREILQGHDDRMFCLEAPIFQMVGFMLV